MKKNKNKENLMDKDRAVYGKSDKTFDIINYTILGIVFLVIFYPLWFVLIASVSDPSYVNSGLVWILPKGFTLKGYKNIFQDDVILIGYWNSIKYTVLGVLISVSITVPAAYALARRELPGRKLFMLLIIITMFFNGGMIPTYLLINDLKIYNTIWAMVLPLAIVPFNLIIARTFFESSIPGELVEAAKIDGCNEFTTFGKIVLPLSKALLAIMVLFYGVAQWNSYFNALIYLRDKVLQPLTLVLRNILILNQVSTDMLGDAVKAAEKQQAAMLIQYGAIVVAALPLLILYPFLQKYFVKGALIGSVKG